MFFSGIVQPALKKDLAEPKLFQMKSIQMYLKYIPYYIVSFW